MNFRGRFLHVFNPGVKEKYKMIFKATLLTILLLSLQCNAWADLTVTERNSEVLKSTKGDIIYATYYTLSDESLDFVKIILPNKTEYTLPRLFSGSGARYTDEFQLKFWSKGHEATIYKRDKNGEWQKIFEECRPVTKK